MALRAASVAAVIAAVVLFWGSLAALAWTHVLYPATVALAARVSTRKRVALDDDYLPSVAVIVTAYNEEDAIERRIENLRELDYPRGAARDRRHLRRVHRPDGGARGGGGRPGDPEPARRQGRGAGRGGARDGGGSRRLLRRERDLGAGRAAEARPQPRRPGESRTSAAGCGSRPPDGGNKEGVYWRYELVTREAESRLGSVTAGNGSIYALRRVGLRRGRSALRSRPVASRTSWCSAGGARSTSPRRSPSSGRRRRTRPSTGARCGCSSTRGSSSCAGACCAASAPGYLLALLSHRHLRYASGLLHLILLGSSIALLGHGAVYAVFLGLQLGLLAAALAGVGIARYYVLVTWATVVSLWNYLRRGVPATWAPQREELA